MIPDTTGMFAGGISPNVGGGTGPDMNALMALFMGGQELLNYGQDTSKTPNFGNVAQAYAGNINKAKMLKQILGGSGKMDQNSQLVDMMKEALNKDTTSKLTLGPTGATMLYDHNTPVLKSFLGGEESFEGAISPPPTPTPTPTTPPTGGGPAVPSPFSVNQAGTDFSNITPGDLVGLTTKDITEVLGAKHAQDQLKGQTYRDIVDAMYKGSVMRREAASSAVDIPYKKALTAQAEAATLENTPSVIISVGDKTMKVTPKDAIAWEKLKKETTPNEVKLFEYARDKQGYKGSIVDFKNIDMTGHEKDYAKVKSEGYDKSFNTWMLEMAKAGAINLGTKLEEVKALTGLKGQLYFKDPKWTGDLSKHLSSEDIQNVMFKSADPTKTRSDETIKFIEGKVIAGGGVIVDARLDKDGKTGIWTVKWPSGDIEEIRQAVK
jgi:hypothetical protein